MSAQAIAPTKMPSKVYESKRSISTMTERDNSTVFHVQWTKTAVATLCVVVQIIALLLKKWSRYIQNEIKRYYDNLVFTTNMSVELLVNTIHAIDRYLGIVIGKFLDTIHVLLAVNRIAAISDVVEGLETESTDAENVASASKATEATRWQETAGNVLGKLSRSEQLEETQLSLTNNSLRHESNVIPEMLQRNRQTIECQEKCVEIIMNTPQPTVLKIEELTYDTLPSNAGSIASFRPDKMAMWRREKFFADVELTITAQVTDERHGGSMTEQRLVTLVKRYGGRAGRYFTMPPLSHFDSRGLATTRPRAQNDTTCDPRVTVTGIPLRPEPLPSPDPVNFSQGRPGLFVAPPQPDHEHFSHGRPGPFAALPQPDPVNFSHGRPGPFAASQPDPVNFSHGRPGPFAAPPQPSPLNFSHGRPGPFLAPSQLSPVNFSHGRPGLFAALSQPDHVNFSHGRSGLFAALSQPDHVNFSHGRPGPFAAPQPDPVNFSHGRPGPFAALQPNPVNFSHKRPGPFVAPSQPSFVNFSHGRPGLFAAPPQPDPVNFSHGRPGLFAAPSQPSPMNFSHGHTGPFTSPPPPGPASFLHGHPGPFAGPPPSGPRSFLYRRQGPLAGPSTHSRAHTVSSRQY